MLDDIIVHTLMPDALRASGHRSTCRNGHVTYGHVAAHQVRLMRRSGGTPTDSSAVLWYTWIHRLGRVPIPEFKRLIAGEHFPGSGAQHGAPGSLSIG